MKPVSTAGFSLVEGIASIVIFGLLMAALTYAMGGLFQQQIQPQVTYNGQTYSRAPSFEVFHDAIDLHTSFSTAVDQADSIMVVGGTRSHPTFDPTGPSSALGETFADSTLPASVGDPIQAWSSWDQLQLNTVQFASYLTAHPDAADFTVLTVQGLSRVTSITQQRRYQATIEGQSLSLYEVTNQTFDWSSGSPVSVPNAATGAGPTYAYRFYYAAGEDTWSVPPGATHAWYRTDPTWDRDQEGPARVIFADPYTLAGQATGATLNPVSRFAYFLPQAR